MGLGRWDFEFNELIGIFYSGENMEKSIVRANEKLIVEARHQVRIVWAPCAIHSEYMHGVRWKFVSGMAENVGAFPYIERFHAMANILNNEVGMEFADGSVKGSYRVISISVICGECDDAHSQKILRRIPEKIVILSTKLVILNPEPNIE